MTEVHSCMRLTIKLLREDSEKALLLFDISHLLTVAFNAIILAWQET